MSDYYFEERRQFRFGFGGITYGVQILILLNVLVFCGQLLVDIPFGGRPGDAPGGIILDWLDFSPAS